MITKKNNGYLISGKVVDLSTGQKIHDAKNCRSVEDFEKFFTKPVRRKLR